MTTGRNSLFGTQVSVITHDDLAVLLVGALNIDLKHPQSSVVQLAALHVLRALLHTFTDSQLELLHNNAPHVRQVVEAEQRRRGTSPRQEEVDEWDSFAARMERTTR